ncbi:MAG: M48 family metallopeptidase [Alphaproteobacteria bacterium]|nr:M48 family metallopeptidase [Alphaproteobacteria bacterium]
MSVDPAAAAAALVVPPFVSIGEAQAFLESRRVWLFSRRATGPERVVFSDGAAIPLRGATIVIRHRPDSRAAAAVLDGMLTVGGRPEHLARRVTDWMKAEARREFASMAAAKAALVDRPPPRLAIGDPRRQWGSCSARGTLRLSWRLLMAPVPVADYVVAHEVAHLIEMNHSRAFWAIVAGLTPHMATARIWLRRHGHSLLRYG